MRIGRSILTFFFAAVLVGPGCSAPPATNPTASAVTLSPETVILDVRNQDEWDAGHREGSHLLPLPQLSQRLADVDRWTGGNKNRPIVVVCRSGNRAGQAQKMLQAAGYTHVENGGAWQSLPSVR
jgi:rhodanese-related sulfurtransferase